ncbi:MAG TPA: hypothetical protein VFM02_00725, partial [Candidatus Paceibacterota bacterium]|nr:hypothetical protein [Candidatus Paceibacterota bacterium]
MEFQKTLFTFFPPPKFLMTRAAGLSLSEDAVRFVEFGDRSGKPILAGFGAKQIPEGMLKDGEIGKPEDLKKILRDFRK